MAVRAGHFVTGILLCCAFTLVEGTPVGFERSKREGALQDRLESIIFRVQTLESHVRQGDRTILKQASNIADLKRELHEIKHGLPRETRSSAETLERELRHMRRGLSNEKIRLTIMENNVRNIKESLKVKIARLQNDIKEGVLRLNRTLIELIQNTITSARAGEKEDDFTCSAGFVRNGRTCYWIHQEMSVRSYDAGVMACTEKEASLVSLETIEEQQFLIGQLRMMGRREWLTSGRKVNNAWEWTGTGRTFQCTDDKILWGEDQPHNSSRETCLSLWKAFDYRLANVVYHGNPRAFICERPAMRANFAN